MWLLLQQPHLNFDLGAPAAADMLFANLGPLPDSDEEMLPVPPIAPPAEIAEEPGELPGTDVVTAAVSSQGGRNKAAKRKISDYFAAAATTPATRAASDAHSNKRAATATATKKKGAAAKKKTGPDAIPA